MGTKNMWADVNMKPVMGVLLRKCCHEMMGVLAEYENDVKQRNTHPILLHKVKIERLTVPEKELLEKIAVLATTKRKTTFKKVPKKGVSRGGDRKLILLRSSATAEQRSVLGEGTCWPGSGP